MMRRIRMAGAAFGAMLVPACMGVQPFQPAPLPVAQAPPRSSTAFAAGPALRVRPPATFATERPEPAPLVKDAGPPLPSAIERVGHRQPEPPPTTVSPPSTEPIRRLPVPPTEAAKPPTPVSPTDPNGVVFPKWPEIKGAPPTVESPGPITPNNDPPASLSAPPVPGMPMPMGTSAAPPPLPSTLTSPLFHQTNASPVSTPTAPDKVADPAPAETPLIKAVRAFQQNRSDEALEHLKAYDGTTQQVLMSLMPAMVRLSDARIQQMKPEELDILLAQLSRVPVILRPRASLLAHGVRLCREVHNFGQIEPFSERHVFRPGDVVYLYMELQNFSCVADSAKGDFTIALASSLELRDRNGAIVWRADPKELPHRISTPPQDYYRNFRMSVPNVPPGAYTLSVKTVDRPTGREVRRTVEMRIGSK